MFKTVEDDLGVVRDFDGESGAQILEQGSAELLKSFVQGGPEPCLTFAPFFRGRGSLPCQCKNILILS